METELGAHCCSLVARTLICAVLVSEVVFTYIYIYVYICIYIYVVKFRDSNLNVNQKPWHPLLRSREMAKLSVLLLFLPSVPSTPQSPSSSELFVQDQVAFGFKVVIMDKDVKTLPKCWLRCPSVCLELNFLIVNLFIDRC